MSKITIFHIFDCFQDYTTKKKIRHTSCQKLQPNELNRIMVTGWSECVWTTVSIKIIARSGKVETHFVFFTFSFFLCILAHHLYESKVKSREDVRKRAVFLWTNTLPCQVVQMMRRANNRNSVSTMDFKPVYVVNQFSINGS